MATIENVIITKLEIDSKDADKGMKDVSKSSKGFEDQTKKTAKAAGDQNGALSALTGQLDKVTGGIGFAADGLLVGQQELNQARLLNNGFERSLGKNRVVLVTEDLDIVRNRIAITEDLATL